VNSTLIVGFGSAYGDDQFGWLVIEQLNMALQGREGIRTICCDHSGVDWIHQYQPVDRLIFVDAVKSDSPPGTPHQLTIKTDELDSLPTTYSSHGIGLREGLALAAEVIELPETIEFYGVTLEQCDSTIASPAITKKIELLTKQLLKTTRLFNPL